MYFLFLQVLERVFFQKLKNVTSIECGDLCTTKYEL